MKTYSKPNGVGLTRLLKAAACSYNGLIYIWKNEAAFRQESVLCLLGVPLAFFLGDNGCERALMIGSLLMVLLVEVVNSAIECAIDRIGPEQHELSGAAKDLGSTAVTLALCTTAIVWLLVLLWH
jgi:diacylglycerol kinase (ATP)